MEYLNKLMNIFRQHKLGNSLFKTSYIVEAAIQMIPDNKIQEIKQGKTIFNDTNENEEDCRNNAN